MIIGVGMIPCFLSIAMLTRLAFIVGQGVGYINSFIFFGQHFIPSILYISLSIYVLTDMIPYKEKEK